MLKSSIGSSNGISKWQERVLSRVQNYERASLYDCTKATKSCHIADSKCKRIVCVTWTIAHFCQFYLLTVQKTLSEMDKHMTFRKYINALYNTHLFGKNKLNFAKRLFDSAIMAGDPQAKPGVETIKSWVYKEDRGYSVDRYFPNRLVDESGFFAFFRQHTKDLGSWKIIQDAFRPLEPDEAFRVDLDTDDRDVFFWSLLNQFQRIFHLPESERENKAPTIQVTVAPQELSPEQIRTVFLGAVHHYNIMEIINRTPPVLNRQDSATLYIFLRQMEKLNLNNAPRSSLLCEAIKGFIDSLWRRAMSLDAALNHRFDDDDETASVNMEDGEGLPADKLKEQEEIGIVDLDELIEYVAAYVYLPDDDDNDDADDDDGDDDDDDVIDANYLDTLLRLRADSVPWRTFRREMNLLFDDISSWQDNA